MTTPMSAFAQIAAKFGDVDPYSEKDVEAFFTNKFDSLSDAEKEAVLEALLEARDDIERTTTQRLPRTEVPLPDLSTAPRATLKGLALAEQPHATRATGINLFRDLVRSYRPVARVPGEASHA